MKKFYRALSLFTLLLLTTLALASCGGYCLHKAADPLRENVVPPTLLADGSYDEVLLCEKCGKELAREQKTLIYDGATLVVDLPGVVIDGVSVSARLGHNTESIDLNAVFSATEQATYAFYSDAACQTPVTGNTLALTKGQTTNVYILFTTQSGYETVYTVSLYRKNTFTVTFDSAGGSAVDAIEVEEGALLENLANAPSKTDYVFAGWDFDFSTPITENITLVARWNESDYVTYRVEYYMQNLAKDGYEIVDSYETTGLRNTVVSAENKAFDHFSLNSSMSQASGTVEHGTFLVLKMYYNRKSYTVTAPNNGGNVSGGKSYTYGATATLTAGVKPGVIDFNGWRAEDGTLLSTESTYSFVVEGNVTINADYTINPALDGFTYRFTLYGELYIKGYEDTSVTDLYVPDCIDGIDGGAFGNCLALEHISLPFIGARPRTAGEGGEVPLGYVFSSISGAGKVAISQFYYATQNSGNHTNTVYYMPATLKHVTVRGGEILNGAFSGCSNLETITFTGDVKIIRASSLYDCSGLKHLYLDDCVESFESGVISGRHLPTDLQYNVLNGLKFLGSEENPYMLLYDVDNFAQTSGICSLPESTRLIRVSALHSNDGTLFEAFEVNESNSYYQAIDGVLFSKDGKTLVAYPCLKQAVVYTAPEGMEYIGQLAFTNCKTLVSLVLPTTFVSATRTDTQDCFPLDGKFLEIVNLSENTVGTYQKPYKEYAESKLTEIDGFYFYTKDRYTHYLMGYAGTDTDITLPESFYYYGDVISYYLYDYAFYNRADLTSVVVPSNLYGVGNYVFTGCNSLESMTVPYVGFDRLSTGTIASWFASEDFVFDGTNSPCPASLKHISITNAYVLNDDAFKPLSALETLSIQTTQGLFVPAHMFESHATLREVHLNGFVSVNGYAFNRCSALTTVVLKNTESIGNYAFNLCTVLTTVTLEGVQSIGNSAFYDCSALATVTLGEGLESIGDRAFYYCTALSSISFPSTLTTIGTDALAGTAITELHVPENLVIEDASLFLSMGLSNITIAPNHPTLTSDGSAIYTKDGKTLILYLTSNTAASFTVPSTVEKISQSAFSSATALQSITLPQGLKEIGNSAFANCTALQELHIPASVTTIGTYVLSGCNALTEVTVPFLGNGNDITHFGYLFGEQERPSYSRVPQTLKKVTILGGETVAYDAFYGCNYIETIIFPDTLLSMEEYFHSDMALQFNEYCGGKYLPTASSPYAILVSCTDTASFAFHADTKIIGSNVFSSNVTNVVIPEGIVSISRQAFYDSDLETITLPSTLRYIGEDAFDYCTELDGVYISSVDGWLNIVFANAEANPLYFAYDLYVEGALLTHLVIPEGTEQLHPYAFYNADCLEKVTFPASFKRFVNHEFYGCSHAIIDIVDLTAWLNIEIADPEYVPFRDSLAAMSLNGTTIRDLVIPEGVESIAPYAFYKVYYIKTITLPSTLKTVGEYAFYSCTALEKLYVPDLTTWCNIDFGLNSNPIASTQSFYVNGTLTTSLVIPATITHIKPYAFTGFEALVSLATSNNLREIGKSAFEGCTGLQNITFGNGIETIDERAFYECTALEEVVLPDGLKTLEEYAFAYCSSLKKVTIPATLTYCGTGAFEEDTALQGIYIFDIAAWCNIEFPSRTANPLYFGAGKLYLNGTVYSTLTLPESVTEIGDYAFAGCKSLRTAVIPSFVTKIGCGTFVDCPNIAYTAYDNAYYVGTEENPYLILVKVKRKDISSCTIHADTVYIGAYAFENCTAITNISVPANVIAVGEGAFYNIRTLSSISFGASVRYIGAWAYYYNAYDGGNLRSVYFRNSTGWIMRHVRTGEEIAATVNDTTYNNALYFKEYNAAHVFIRND